MVLIVVFFYLSVVATVILAGRSGGAPERIAAAITVAGTLLSKFAAPGWHDHFRTLEYGVFAVDCAMLVAFLALALASTRYWPLWITSLQGVAVVNQMAVALNPQIVPIIYVHAQGLTSLLIQPLIIVGVLRHHWRLKSQGIDPAWTWQIPPGQNRMAGVRRNEAGSPRARSGARTGDSRGQAGA